ncbi:hypothetical protein BUL40_08830 [Croceivirga radicis]|uniref:Uncharacterized protein n=1 Tax=Croceivirga radicis TaxID=1929488 RepID=A0A1V6LR14_9FLAO|nr:hypothetical protein [Croceivirga radicis]OQD42623.1 hypothetical protein BUL40_08830 [Croceivirga radicis]
MCKKLTLLPVLLFCFLAHSQLEKDKALHFLGGNLYGLAGAGIAKQISKGNRFWTFAGAVGGSALIGLGKEAIDSGKGGSGWDNEDLLATVLGGLTVGVTIDLFTNHERQKKRFAAKQKLNAQYYQLPKDLSQKKGLPTLTQLASPNLIRYY